MFVRPLRRAVRSRILESHFHSSSSLWATKKVLQRFKLADIGEGITECEVIKWSVGVKSKIEAFDALCEVQSDKASVEITSPFDGTVTEILVQEGEVAKVGADLCIIESEEEVVDGAEETTPKELEKPPVVEQPSVSQPLSQASVPAPRKLHPMDPKFVPISNQTNILAAPSTRHFAREHSVDLAQLAPGSGKGGRVEKRDIEQFLSSGSSAPEPTPGVLSGNDVVVELGRTRHGMWKAMTKSLEIPHFGYSTTLDLTELHEMLPIFNTHIPPHYLPAASQTNFTQAVSPASLYPPPSPPTIPEHSTFTRITYLPILLKTLSKAMIEWPLFRSSITPNTEGKPTLTVRPNADISIALSTPTGLYSPTLQATNTRSIYELSSQLKNLSHLGRQTPTGLSPKEMPKRGGTITVSNVGAIGAGDFAAPVLVPGGGVAIVAIGRAKWVWDVDRGDGKGERRLKVGISWAADHRVVEGAELAAFVECWRSFVETPQRLIVEGI